jgi:hypothetical protein
MEGRRADTDLTEAGIVERVVADVVAEVAEEDALEDMEEEEEEEDLFNEERDEVLAALGQGQTSHFLESISRRALREFEAEIEKESRLFGALPSLSEEREKGREEEQHPLPPISEAELEERQYAAEIDEALFPPPPGKKKKVQRQRRGKLPAALAPMMGEANMCYAMRSTLTIPIVPVHTNVHL